MTQDYYGTKRVTAWSQLGGDDGATSGYAVKYADGYISWSPKAVFEAAYMAISAMNFGHALVAVKEGHKVARSGWNGKGMWLELQTPDENSKMTLPYLFLNYPNDAQSTPGARVPWLASQTDMLADDWGIVENCA